MSTISLSKFISVDAIFFSPKSSAISPYEWLKKLLEKKPLYSPSLPCVEAWLRNLGFLQSKEDRVIWFSGPGNVEKDVERRFSHALSREDIENAILGGP
ncbi:hypothetical protein PVL29_006318 [Vitis rotundifolia]|uniref:Uncharacterized protein n=1 Tax=Vitis rotundifolia TaxID=103349 RepID=A0AA39E0S7_VITRO|nr:hypothetical protein PVL29_006318 [Vitis rotundifolia]